MNRTSKAKWAGAVVLVLGAIGAIGVTGCRARGWLPPAGPMLQQQNQAIVNDPFPQGDIAPTDNAQRPPGYAQPLPDATRNRLWRDSAYGFGR